MNIRHDVPRAAPGTTTGAGRPTGTRRPSRVSFFATCLADRFFARACRDAVAVLEHFGVEVDVPAGQTCCGQPAYNTGMRAEAERMARHTVRVFSGSDPVVLPSGSCAGMVRSFYPKLVEDGSARSAAAGQELSERAHELCGFLVHALGVLDGPHLGDGLAGVRVAYHHGCHALRELGQHDEPVELLRACGAEVLPWNGNTECCGFGGLFSTKFPQVSAGMADRKLDALPPDIDVVTSADGGCLLQLSGRATRRDDSRHGAPHTEGTPTRRPQPKFVHVATLLRRGLGL